MWLSAGTLFTHVSALTTGFNRNNFNIRLNLGVLVSTVVGFFTSWPQLLLGVSRWSSVSIQFPLDTYYLAIMSFAPWPDKVSAFMASMPPAPTIESSWLAPRPITSHWIDPDRGGGEGEHVQFTDFHIPRIPLVPGPCPVAPRLRGGGDNNHDPRSSDSVGGEGEAVNIPPVPVMERGETANVPPVLSMDIAKLNALETDWVSTWVKLQHRLDTDIAKLKAKLETALDSDMDSSGR